MKNFTLLLLSVLLICLLAIPAAAADSVVEYSGHSLFNFTPGSSFTETDLFDNFKGVMPGDTLTETVTVKNSATCCDYIAVYLRVEPHDETGNPLSPNVAAKTDLPAMTEFLQQLKMTVEKGNDVLFEGSPDTTGGLENNLFLCTMRPNSSIGLTVTLEVPIELGNNYANRVGEVDWVFTVQEFNDEPTPDTTAPETETDPPETEPEPPVTETEPPVTEPEPPETQPLDPETEPTPDTEPEPPVTEPEPPVTEPEPVETEPEPVETEPTPDTEPIPEDDPRLPQTGLLWWPVPVLFALGLVLCLVGLLLNRKHVTEE